MWEQVSRANAVLVERALSVIAAHSWQGSNPTELAKWLSGRFLFFYDGSDYEWVIGFEKLQPEQSWRIVAEGFVGNFSAEAAKRPVELLLAFLSSHKSKTACILVPHLISGTPTYAIYQAVFNAARANAKVVTVTVEQLNTSSRWVFELR